MTDLYMSKYNCKYLHVHTFVFDLLICRPIIRKVNCKHNFLKFSASFFNIVEPGDYSRLSLQLTGNQFYSLFLPPPVKELHNISSSLVTENHQRTDVYFPAI
jgi:hypothetical protein